MTKVAPGFLVIGLVSIAALVIAFIAVLAYITTRGSHSEHGLRGTEVWASTDPVEDSVAPSAGPLDGTRVPVGPGGPVSRAAPSPGGPSGEERQGSIRARFLDVQGTPIEGVQLVLVDAEVGPALSGSDGIATLGLSSGLASALGPTLFLEARTRGFALDRRRVRAARGEELLLGDWTLIAAGAVEGRVLDEEGIGIARVEVARFSETITARVWDDVRRAELDALARPGARARTGPDGAFRLEDVPAGEIRLVAVAEDRPAARSEPVDVPIGGLATGVEIEMEEADGGTTITGVVLDPHGEPVPHAPYVVRSSGSESRLHAGPDGRFEFRAHDKRPVDLAASDPERRHGDADRKGVVPGTHGLELRLRGAPALELIVRAPGGEPIERYAVVLLAERTLEGLAFFAEGERASGLFSTAAPEQGFLMEVRANGWRPGRIGPFAPGELRRVECVLEPAHGLHGMVTAAARPLAGARLALHEVLTSDDRHNDFPIRIEPRHSCATTSGMAGEFLLSVDAPGEYSLLVEAEGYALAELGPIALAPDTEHELDVELGTGGALSIRVRSARGSSVAGRLVACSRGDGRARTQRTNEHGEVELELLTPGPWMVVLVDQELDPEQGVRIFGAAPLGEVPSNCRVVPGLTTPVDLWLDEEGEPCRLSGRLTIDGAPAEEWRVALDRDGVVVLDDHAFREPGVFQVGVAEPGRYRLRLSPGTLDSSAMLVILETVDLIEGERAWSIDLRTGVLDGRLTGGGADALLFLRVQDGPRELLAPLAPDPEGRFRCALAPAGQGEIVRYDQSVPLGEQRPVSMRQVTIVAGRTTTIDP